MLKPGDPSGSAFLKVDPTYIQHWQQLFPQAQLKNGALAQLQAPERVAIPVESLRQRANLISAPSATSSGLPSSSSSTHSSCASSAVSSLAGLTQLSVPQIALFGQTLCTDLVTADSNNNNSQSKELCLSSSNFKNDKGSKFKLTSEELDYYLYGQQRMEIIPLNNHTGDQTNRT